MSVKTEPEVFIIESLRFEDEALGRGEGEIISRILSLSGKECRYYYVRTKKELRAVLRIFEKSRYRYLHLSCHANDESMATTLDGIFFTDLATMLKGKLAGRRLFVSACSMASEELADALMPGTDCYSIIGPNEDVHFGDAAILWASLYHVMFKVDRDAMKRKALRSNARMLGKAFGISLNLFVQDRATQTGHRLIALRPRKRKKRRIAPKAPRGGEIG